MYKRQLLDNDGNEVTSTPAYAADGTTEIGTYSIDSATGQVTFTPTDKSYTGAVTPAKVQAGEQNIHTPSAYGRTVGYGNRNR